METAPDNKLKSENRAVIGSFPSLPFLDNSFDRILSRNAITMHAFDEGYDLSRYEWRVWWDEILRVLKSGGRAYVGPFDRITEYGYQLLSSELAQMRKEGIINKIEVDSYFENEDREFFSGAVFNGPSYIMIEKP